jgi:hypothetical protein
MERGGRRLGRAGGSLHGELGRRVGGCRSAAERGQQVGGCQSTTKRGRSAAGAALRRADVGAGGVVSWPGAGRQAGWVKPLGQAMQG